MVLGIALLALQCAGDTIINLTDPDDGTGTSEKLPAGPTDLNLTVMSPSSIALNWTDNSGNESGFRVLRGSSADAISTVAATLGEETKSYEDTGLQPSTTYH